MSKGRIFLVERVKDLGFSISPSPGSLPHQDLYMISTYYHISELPNNLLQIL